MLACPKHHPRARGRGLSRPRHLPYLQIHHPHAAGHTPPRRRGYAPTGPTLHSQSPCSLDRLTLVLRSSGRPRTPLSFSTTRSVPATGTTLSTSHMPSTWPCATLFSSCMYVCTLCTLCTLCTIFGTHTHSHRSKDDAVLKDNGENKLPDYQQWNADRERDIEMVFGWVSEWLAAAQTLSAYMPPPLCLTVSLSLSLSAGPPRSDSLCRPSASSRCSTGMPKRSTSPVLRGRRRRDGPCGRRTRARACRPGRHARV